jgi:hypothetical protein
MTTNFLLKKSKKILKNAELLSKTSLTNMSKSVKSVRHVFANNFLLVHFFKTFSTDSKSACHSAVFDTHIEYLNKILALFVNFNCKCAGNGSKKLKIFFMNVS